jgi:acyl-coenzyme A synthetase/AMP-(fatty) acid ligase
MDVRRMHVLDTIMFWAKARPNYPAIIQSDMVISYSGLAEAIQTISARIADLNLNPNEPVAVSIEHPAKQLVAIFALLHCGFTPAPVYRGLLPFLRGAGIDNLFYSSEAQVLSGGRNIRFDDSWLLRDPSAKASIRKRPDRRSDIIFFSSGTTGLPKKHIHTGESVFERMKTTALRDADDSSRVLVMPSAASTFGFYRACELFYMGKTACFSLPGEMTLALINSYCIEEILASPQQILALVDLIEKGAARYQLSSLKSVGIGGGLASRALVRRVQANLCPQVKIIYGSTEAGVIAFANYDTIASIPNAVGYVLPWVEIEIVDDSGAALPARTEGYIRCRTPIFSQSSSANDSDSKAEAHVWWYPGDLGNISAEGVLCVSGRTGDVINRGGIKMSAAALEEVLVSRAGVKDGGACGIMGESGITELWIGVVPEAKIDIGTLKRNLESDEKFNARIDEILLLDNIPRNELGKIKRHELRDMLVAAKKSSAAYTDEPRTALTL